MLKKTPVVRQFEAANFEIITSVQAAKKAVYEAVGGGYPDKGGKLTRLDGSYFFIVWVGRACFSVFTDGEIRSV